MDRSAIWAMFYASVMGMGLHPGTTRDGAPRMTPRDGARIADEMLHEYAIRWPSTE